MDFFKSVFSDDPQSSSSDPDESGETDPHDQQQSSIPNPDSDSDSTTWSFGGLIKTLASKSESVIDHYRRDLEEFSSELKKETAVIREVASRAVMDLPSSLDAGASVAQESLESVGQALDDIGSSVWNSTAQIITHGRDTLLAADLDSDCSVHSYVDKSTFSNRQSSGRYSSQVSDLKRYSRFDALLLALQSDVKTYMEEPEDLGDYDEWKKLGFDLEKKGEEIQNLIEENGVIEGIYSKVVPSRIDQDSFWSRYFYRLHKLKQAEDTRAKLVKRAISGEEEEDLSWDFDDEEEDGNDGYEPKGNSSGVMELEEATVDENAETGKKDLGMGSDVKGNTSKSESELKSNDNMESNTTESGSDNGDKLDVKFDEKAALEARAENGESCKDSDISVVSSQPSMPEEEDISWDEIEDIGSNGESKEDDGVGNKTRIDLRPRFSAADQEEELSWEVEDDDDEEVIKS